MSLRDGLLGLLTKGPASGYDLLKNFDDALSFVWPASQSQIYTELVKMADEGLLTVSVAGARNRKVYEITPAGRRRFHEWMVEGTAPFVYRSEFLLRTFFLWAVSKDESREILEAFRRDREGLMERLSELRDGHVWNPADPLEACARAVLEYGLRAASMQDEWAEWTLETAIEPRSR